MSASSLLPSDDDRDYRQLFQRADRLTAALRDFETLSLAVSHDFAIPLRAIDERLRALAEPRGGSGSDVLREVHAMRDALRRIDRMMADLDELCRSGVRPLMLELVDMDALVREVCASQAGADGVALALGRLPPARGDARMLRIVWRHLLESATARCAGRPGARIEITGGGSSAFSVYGVRDNGIDLGLRLSGKLCRSFDQIQRQSTHPGTGVALAIVQRLVTRHRGNVWVEASPGKGTFFQFSIGEMQAEAPSAASPELDSPRDTAA